MRRVHVVAYADPQVQRPPSGMHGRGVVERRARVAARTRAGMGAVQAWSMSGRGPATATAATTSSMNSKRTRMCFYRRAIGAPVRADHHPAEVMIV